MASKAEVERERSAPKWPVDLTVNELHTLMTWALAREDANNRAGHECLSDVSEPAERTLAEKLPEAWSKARSALEATEQSDDGEVGR